MDTGVIDYEFSEKPPRFHKVGESSPVPVRDMLDGAKSFALPEIPKNLWLLAALQSRPHIYAGTVTRSVVRKRRARNKRARISRRHNR